MQKITQIARFSTQNAELTFRISRCTPHSKDGPRIPGCVDHPGMRTAFVNALASGVTPLHSRMLLAISSCLPQPEMPSILANAACRRGIGRLRLGLRLGSRCRCAAGYGGARGVACRLHVLRWQPITARIVHGPQQSVFDRQRPCRCSVSR